MTSSKNPSSSIDLRTRAARSALDVVFARYATRTSVGMLMGQVAFGILPSNTWGSYSSTGWVTCEAIGVLLALFPLLFKKRAIDEAYQRQFDLIDEAASRGNLTDTQVKMAYLSVIQKAIGEIEARPKSASRKSRSDNKT